MQQQLIVLRGNSGSGKTTVAKRLQIELGPTTMLVSQDVVRREILGVKDFPGNPAVQLLYEIVMYGKSIGYSVILEGILSNNIYREMLVRLIAEFDEKTQVYYFDIPFEETIKRHATKANRNDFTHDDMKDWWIDKDYLQVADEEIITQDMSEDAIVALMLQRTKVV